MVDAGLVPAHDVLDGFVGSEVDGVRRAWRTQWSALMKSPWYRLQTKHSPAPTITLDMPRHKLKTPSVLAIRYVA